MTTALPIGGRLPARQYMTLKSEKDVSNVPFTVSQCTGVAPSARSQHLYTIVNVDKTYQYM